MSRKRLAGFLGFFVWVVVASRVATGSSTVSAPSDVRALSASESRIDLSWQDRSTNETGFEIHRSTSGATGSYTLLSGTAAQAVSWTDSGLNPSTGYCYKVRAVRTVGA